MAEMMKQNRVIITRQLAAMHTQYEALVKATSENHYQLHMMNQFQNQGATGFGPNHKLESKACASMLSIC